MQKRLAFYFDFLSPFSYLSWSLLQKNHFFNLGDEEIEFHPVILGKILGHWGIKGPAEVSPKRNLLYRRCLRLAEKASLPLQTPAKLPFNSLYALRLSLKEVSGPHQKKVMETLWNWGWSLGGDLEDPDLLLSVLEQAGLPGKELMEKISQRVVREALKQSTQSALERGVFGVPSFWWNEELFWGTESLEDLQNIILGHDVFRPLDYQVFLNKHPFM